jgi:L-methionine (R)-S-oxide reductase
MSAKSELYARLNEQFASLVLGERDFIANAANAAALLYHGLPELNWAGFYLFRGDSNLVLGPFQGQPACVRIGWGRGVCGTAAAQGRTVIVPDVHQFPGHIACDSASDSEIVVPLVDQGRVVGVLDLDSPQYDRFDADDAAGLEPIARALLASSDLDSFRERQ